MAIDSVRAGLLFPQVFNGGDSKTTQVLDAVGEKIGSRWCIWKNDNITQIQLDVTAITGTPTYDVRLETIASGLPSGTLFAAGTNVSFSPTVTGIQNVTLTTAAGTVLGNEVAAVIEASTADGSNFATFGLRDPENGIVPFLNGGGTVFVDTGGGYAPTADCARFGPVHSDGARVWGSGVWNGVDTNNSWHANTNPDERGICFTARRTIDMLGIAAYIRASHASLSDYDLVLYDAAGSALRTINVDVSVSYNTTASYQYVAFGFSSPYTLTADTTYYIFAKPTSTTQTIQMPVFDDYPTGGGAHIAQCGAASLKYASRNDGGSITTDDTKMAPISPIVDFATGASGSTFIRRRRRVM